ncbi:MAG: phenylacetate--CoA ligase family protein [Actinomycetota bacterium]|nr:phenylacetate--CoA ligase family protein [Actinomycetota bacterium]
MAVDCWNPEVEKMPLGEVREMQSIKLRRQLASLCERSPFYARKFAGAAFDPDAVRSIDDLARAPFTEKRELRDSRLRFPPLGEHAATALADVIRIHSSSGTTGQPSYIGITRADRERWTEVISRAYWCEGVRPEDVVIHGFGLGFFVGGLPLKDAIENIGATFVPIGTGASDRLITSIGDLGGTILTCTPSYATYLAEFIGERFGSEPHELGLRRILLGAEPGGGVPAVQARIAELYGAFVTEGLGNADVCPVYAGTCDELDGNHFLAPDQIVLELIDPDTGDVLDWDDGAEGELVATHIERDCVPLVRFRTRDRVVIGTGPCPCGRTGPRIRCVGRTDDMLIVAGVNVWPSAVSDIVMQLHPRTTGSMQILLDSPPPKVEPPLNLQVEYASSAVDLAELKRDLEMLIRDKLIVKCRVDLVAPGTLPRFEMKARPLRRVYEELAG